MVLAAFAGNGPDAVVADLAPSHAENLSRPAAGQQQQLQHRRQLLGLGGLPELDDLGV
jgi:hypothetical protein